MCVLVLEPKTNKPVRGTMHLQGEAKKHIRNTSQLKHGSKISGDLMLAPQPSDSLNDPLSKFQGLMLTMLMILTSHFRLVVARKMYKFIFLSLGTGLMAGTHNFVNPLNALNAPMAKLIHTSMRRFHGASALLFFCSASVPW
jgi:hypothetical protein